MVDALKLSPPNPSFLDMRDAILAALDAQRAAGRLDEATHSAKPERDLACFGKFGMGPGATSNGVPGRDHADFTLPPELGPPDD